MLTQRNGIDILKEQLISNRMVSLGRGCLKQELRYVFLKIRTVNAAYRALSSTWPKLTTPTSVWQKMHTLP